MIEVMMWLAVFIASLTVLVKSSDLFTDSAEEIGLYLGIPAFIVGVTIVSAGTSLPELVTSVIAVMDGSTEIVAGTVVGSNISNLLFVLGLSAIVRGKIKVAYDVIHVDLPLLMGSAFMLGITLWDGLFTFGEAVLFLMGLAVYLGYTVEMRRDSKSLEAAKLKGEAEKIRVHPKTWLTLVASSFFIYLGARYTIESVITLSELIGVGEEIIAVSAIALGTSLPEAMVSLTAAMKGKSEIALGNIMGSNIFNTFAVMSVPALFKTLVVAETIRVFAVPVMLIATVVATLIVQDKQVTKWEGYILLLFYILFQGKLFNFL